MARAAPDIADARADVPLRWRRRRIAWSALGDVLEAFDARFPAASRVAADPVSVARLWTSPVDREIAGLVAASLAFGRASVAIDKARAALEPFGADLAGAARDLRPCQVPPHLEAWKHRWIDGPAVATLVADCGRLVRESGSLGAAFAEGDRGHADDLGPPLRAFALRLRSRDASAARAALVPVPDGRAASKRLCLYLRWMARADDGVDLGLWTGVGTRRLTVPLDTHVARIGAYVGLTDRRTPGWQMAREITSNLARFDPEDPTRFDFALSHLGIMGGCPRRRDPRACAACDLVPACRL